MVAVVDDLIELGMGGGKYQYLWASKRLLFMIISIQPKLLVYRAQAECSVVVFMDAVHHGAVLRSTKEVRGTPAKLRIRLG
ncbi:hypothetical protein MALU111345_00985 [Marinicrinis lubricantis]